MEEDPRYLPVKSIFLKRSTIQKQLDLVKHAVEEAEDIIHYEQAHNPEIIYALDIIEQFLRRRKRVCYGGTAINAVLPKKLRFYDETKDLPDYDFFTPDPETDVEEVVLELKKAGFSEVVQRIGMHAGTFKILVNFIPIADISKLDPDLYKIVYQRSIVREGIHYTDPDFLRMMMYLELSRPRGEVSRWEKVFERLSLLNAAFPPKVCKKTVEEITGRVRMPTILRKEVLNYVLDNNRILMGAEVIALYDWMLHKKYKKKPSVQWFLHKNGMLVFLSPQAVRDAILLKDSLNNDSVMIETLRGKEDIVPERVLLQFHNKPFLMIVQESACHSYNEIPLQEGRKLRIGTLETLLTLYYALDLFTEDKKYLQFSMLCLTQKLVEMGNAFYRLGSDAPIPVFSIECSGYQKGYATLLKEKFARIKKERKKKSTVKNNKPKSARSKTRRG
jgi:hypothetical protein